MKHLCVVCATVCNDNMVNFKFVNKEFMIVNTKAIAIWNLVFLVPFLDKLVLQ